MPITNTITVTANEVKKGDYVHGLGTITAVKPLEVNIDLVAEGSSKRLRKSAHVHLDRTEKTLDERIAETSERLVEYIDKLYAATDPDRPFTCRLMDKLNEATTAYNVEYAIHWYAEEALIEAHRVMLRNELGRALRTLEDPTAAQVVEMIKHWQESLTKQQLSWYNSNSTSMVSNVSNLAKHEALRKMNDSMSDWTIHRIVWSYEMLLKLIAERDEA